MFSKLSWIINFQKGGTCFFVAALMALYRAADVVLANNRELSTGHKWADPAAARTLRAELEAAKGTLEAVKVKLLLLGDEAAPSAVRVELTSENDLFFHYMHEVRDRGYRDLQERHWR